LSDIVTYKEIEKCWICYKLVET